MKRTRHKIMLAVVVVLALYRIGPTLDHEPSDSKLPQVLYDVSSVDTYVNEKEAQVETKKDNEARIYWADSAGQVSDYVLLYIHGFSASWYEGYPVNVNFAETLGCNAYYARLAEHGVVSDDPLLNLTPKNLYDSAKEALLIAKTIGKKVIIMSTSTGGTLSLMLAADYPDLVDGLVMYSPNIVIKQKSATLLTKPWGFNLGKLVQGGEMRHLEGTELEAKYWNLDYRMEATVRLQQLLEERMNPVTYAKVKCPVFLGYYYKDEDHQDDVVSVEAMLEMYKQLGTDKKYKKAFPTAGRHTIAFIEGGSYTEVSNETIEFAKEYLGM